MAKLAYVVGLDLSLTGAGMCRLPARAWDGEWDAAWFRHVGYGLASATQAERIHRIVEVTDAVLEFAARHNVTSVFIEGYAFSRQSSSVTKLAELGGAVRYALATELGLVAQEVTASRARAYLLGKLPPKNQKAIAQATVREFCPLPLTGDEVDAWVVANCGLGELGLPGVSVAK